MRRERLIIFSAIILFFILASIYFCTRIINAGLPDVIYTNRNPVIIELGTDAVSFYFTLNRAEKLVKTGTGNFSNAIGKMQNNTVNLGNLPEGNYQLDLSLKDEVLNITKRSQSIVVDRTIPIIEIKNIAICGNNLCSDVYSNENVTLKITERNTKFEKTFNLNQGNNTAIILENWQINSNYHFSFLVTDLAGNSAVVIGKDFQSPVVENGAGEVFGVDTDHPWGKDNNYTNQLSRAIMETDLTKKEITTRFKDFQLPAPVITSSVVINNGWVVYLNTISPQMRIQFQVETITPSYFSALNLCGLSDVYRYLKPFLITDLNCLTLRLNVKDMKPFWYQMDLTCNQYFWPWEIRNCQDQFLSRSYTSAKVAILANIDTVTIDYLNSAGKLIQPVVVTATQTKNTLLVGQVLSDRLIKARANLWGSVRYDNKTYNFSATSVLSNTFQLANDNNRTIADSKCQNSACRVANVTYTNQWANSKGKYLTWPSWEKDSGGKSCGAASAVMVTNYFKQFTKESDPLQTYIFKDNGQNLTSKKCDRPGAFAVTSYDKNCNQSSLESIRNYLKQYGLQTKVHWPDQSTTEKFVTEVIKPALEKNHMFILSYKKPIGHILVIKGITYNNRLVVNDPYRDFQNNYRKGVYDYTGKDAIYQLKPNNSYQLNYLIEVYQ